MNIKLHKKDDLKIFSVEGELTRLNSKVFLEKMQQFVEKEPYIVLKMSKVDFIDSGGIGALVDMANQLRSRDTQLLLYWVNDYIMNVFANTQVIHQFQITHDMDELLQRVQLLRHPLAARMLRKNDAIEDLLWIPQFV